MGFRLNRYCLLTSYTPSSAVLAGPWVVWREKQLLLSVSEIEQQQWLNQDCWQDSTAWELSPIFCGQAGLSGLGPAKVDGTALKRHGNT